MRLCNVLATLSIASLLASCSDATVGTNNSAPQANIELPAPGAQVQAGVEITFLGGVQDTATAAPDLRVTWTSSIDEQLFSGNAGGDGVTTFVTSDLSPGLHTITLQVRDAEGAAGRASVDLLVVADGPPTLVVESPTADGVYYSDHPVSLQATVGDAEDALADLRVDWSAEDVLAEGVVPDTAGSTLASATLEEGTHTLAARVTDTVGNTSSATVTIVVGPPNTAPTCSITAPADRSAAPLGDAVQLEGEVADVDVPPEWLTASFESDLDGPLGDATPSSEGSVAVVAGTLTEGTHTLTMTVTDEVGAACLDSIVLTVSAPPTATIVTPSAGAPLSSGEALTMTGTVADAEDPADSLAVTWTSDVDGALGTPLPDGSGAVTQAFALSAGPHVLTLTRIGSIRPDPRGRTGTPAASNWMHTNAVDFGIGLQLTNVLKDCWRDANEGRRYLPSRFVKLDGGDRPGSLQPLVALAMHRLERGIEYTAAIPYDHAGIRDFCLVAIALAAASLQAIRRRESDLLAGHDVKLGRAEVGAIVAAVAQVVGSNTQLRAYWAELSDLCDG